VAKLQNSIRYAALLGNSDAEATGKTNRTSWPQGNADGADDETTVSRAEPVYPKPLRRIECRGTVWSPEKASWRDGLKARQVALALTSQHRKSAQRPMMLPDKIFLPIESLLYISPKNPLDAACFPQPCCEKENTIKTSGKGEGCWRRAQNGRFFSGLKRPGKWYTPPSPR
jgi:hypothetical protein